MDEDDTFKVLRRLPVVEVEKLYMAWWECLQDVWVEELGDQFLSQYGWTYAEMCKEFNSYMIKTKYNPLDLPLSLAHNTDMR